MTGTAPGAELMALKVFGEGGSTALVIDALEMATYNYLLYGWPQVINMSLGSSFGTNDPSNPSVLGSENAALAGITVIASAGNAGNNHYITGSPAAADRAVSVAASTTGYVTGPTINISGTAYITQTDIVYTPASFDDNTGHYTQTTSAPLAYVGNLDGALDNQLCSTDTITPTNALDGQIALIQRGSCTFSSKVNNAAALGAVGTIIYNNVPGPFGGIGDPVDIPAAFIQMPDGENLIPADGEIVIVNARDDVETVPDPYTPADYIGSFSSRGPRGYDSALKPEIAAPGVAIFAANMGSGTGGVSLQRHLDGSPPCSRCGRPHAAG
jgi:minor extracellular serine protease Vpr